MIRHFLIFFGLFFIQEILVAQIFDEQVLDTDSLPIRKIESETFQLDNDGNAHILIYSPNDSSNNLYYMNNANDGYIFSKPLLVKAEEIAEDESVFFHFISMVIDSEGIVYIFYMREEAKHDEQQNITLRNDQITCIEIKLDASKQETVIYQTPEYILNSKYMLDSKDNIHVAFLLQSDSFDPESPKIINYVNNITGNFDQVKNVSGEVKDASLHHFQFLLDNDDQPNFFTTNYDGSPMKNYLNHWYESENSYVKSKIDSTSESLVNPWFESVNATLDSAGQIQLLYFLDSMYQIKIPIGNKFFKQNLSRQNFDTPLWISEFEVCDSISFSQVFQQGEIYKYYLWNYLKSDAIHSFESNFIPVGFEFDKQGYVQGIGLRKRDGQFYHEIIHVKSAIPFDPLPILPPDPPEVEDKVFCLEDEKIIFYNGVGITWYENDLRNSIGIGDTLELGNLQPGLYQFMATETIFNSTSEPDTFYVNINLPEVDLGIDTLLAYLDSITILAGDHFVSYNWSTGSDSSSVLIIGERFEPGELLVYLEVINEYGCYSDDSILVTIERPLALEQIPSNDLKLFPNPSNGFITIELTSMEFSSNAELLLYDIGGKLLLKIPIKKLPITVNFNHFKSGIHILKIIDSEKVLTKKIVLE